MKRWLLALLALLCIAGIHALIVEKVSISTNFPIDNNALLQAASLPTGEEYEAALVNASINAMQVWLQSQGHPFVRIPFPDLIPLSASGMELSFLVEEVLPADQVSLRFTGLRYFTEAKLRSLLLLSDSHKSGIADLPRIMQRILDLYQSRGFFFVTVQLDSLLLEESLTAYIGISEGKLFRLEKYYFQGNKYTGDKTLIKLSGLSQSAVINPAALESARESILRKSYINSCIIEPIDSSSLLIKVEEGKMTYLEGVLGLARRNGKTELTGLMRLQFLNLWGSDRSIRLNWQQTLQSSKLELGYHESGPNSFPLSADIALNRTVQDSTWVKSSLSADIYSYHADQKYGVELATQGISPGERRPMIIQSTSSRSIGAFWRLDSRDQQLNPSRGMQTGITYRISNSSSGKRWSNAVEADHAQFLGLSRRWTVAAGFHLRSLADSTDADYQLYRLGGFNSLRGYREDEFSSWRLAWASLELRYLINSQSRVYLFYDHGLFSSAEGLKSDIFAPGLGIKVKTRLGILSIEYGLGYRDKGFADLGSGMIHAGLDASF